MTGAPAVVLDALLRLAVPPRHGARLALRVVRSQRLRRQPGGQFFDVVGTDDGERDAHFAQQLFAARRRAGQDEGLFAGNHVREGEYADNIMS